MSCSAQHEGSWDETEHENCRNFTLESKTRLQKITYLPKSQSTAGPRGFHLIYLLENQTFPVKVEKAVQTLKGKRGSRAPVFI